jgi:hypothetical protein
MPPYPNRICGPGLSLQSEPAKNSQNWNDLKAQFGVPDQAAEDAFGLRSPQLGFLHKLHTSMGHIRKVGGDGPGWSGPLLQDGERRAGVDCGSG